MKRRPEIAEVVFHKQRKLKAEVASHFKEINNFVKVIVFPQSGFTNGREIPDMEYYPLNDRRECEMNIPDVAEKVIEAVKNTPKIEREEWCHGEPHFYSVPDWDTIELAVQDILVKSTNDKEIK